MNFRVIVPEEEHQSLQEGAEVVMVVDSGVLIEVNVPKNL